MIIGVYCTLYPKQELFDQPYDPKFCIKKIKSEDTYLGYLCYAHMCYLLKKSDNIEDILSELMDKYKNRVEAFFFYWQFLIKKKNSNLRKAYNIAENYWKNSSSIKFDDSIY